MSAAIGALFFESAKTLGKKLGAKAASEAVIRVTGHFGLPKNHDAQKAIRRSQLYAIQHVLNQYESVAASDWSNNATERVATFLRAGHKVVRERLGISAELTLQLNEAVTGKLTGLIRHALVEASSGSDKSFMAAAEKCVFDELKDWLDKTDLGIAIPEDFKDAFFGNIEGVPSWYVAFVGFVSEALKTDSRFYAIFNATRLEELASGQIDIRSSLDALHLSQHDSHGAISAVAENVGEVLRSISEARRELSKSNAELVEALEQQKAAIAAQAGVPVAALTPILAKLQLQNIPDGEIPQRLMSAVERLLELSVRKVESDGGDYLVRQTISQARSALAELNADEAIQTLENAVEQTVKTQTTNLISLLEEKADIQLRMYDYEAAESTLRRVIGLDSSAVNARLEIANIQEAIGNIGEAVATLRAASVIAKAQGRSLECARALSNEARLLRRNIGDKKRSLASSKSAVKFLEAIFSSENKSSELVLELVKAKVEFGRCLLSAERVADAIEAYQDALVLCEDGIKGGIVLLEGYRQTTIVYEELAQAYFQNGESDAALNKYETVLELRRALVEQVKGEDSIALADLSVVHSRMADILHNDDTLRAFEHYRACFELSAQIAAKSIKDRQATLRAITAQERYALCLGLLKRFDEAEFEIKSATLTATTLIDQHRDSFEWVNGLSRCYQTQAAIFGDQGKFEEALEETENAIDQIRKFVRRFGKSHITESRTRSLKDLRRALKEELKFNAEEES